MPRLALTLAILAGAFLTVPANAQAVPAAIEAWARKIEKSCAASYRGKTDRLAKHRNPEWLRVIHEAASGKVYLAHGDKTRCEPEAQLICGTGGCPIAVFHVGKSGARKWYDQQTLGAKIDASPPELRMPVHALRCGKFGPHPCETIIDLSNGKQRTGVPKE